LPPPDMQQLICVTAGTLSPAEFFAPENIGPIFATAATSSAVC
jgi:hypothetical protein